MAISFSNKSFTYDKLNRQTTGLSYPANGNLLAVATDHLGSIVAEYPPQKGALSSSATTLGAAATEKTVPRIGTEKSTDIVRYAGMTGRDPLIRIQEHLNSGTNRARLLFEIPDGATQLTKIQARTWEQTLINQYGLHKNGGTLYNLYNSIAPSKWSLYSIPQKP